MPGSVTDSNNVSWGPNELDPAKLALANTFFDNVQKGDGAVEGAIDSVKQIVDQVGEGSEDVKKAQKDVDLKLKEDKKKINNEEKEDLREKKIKNKTILDIIIDAIFSFKKNEPLVKKRDYDPNMDLVAFIEIFSFFYKQYQEKLRESVPENFKGIDYDDQIIMGSKYIEKEFKKNNFLKHLRRTNDVSKKNQNVRTTCTSTSYVVYQGESA